MLGRTLRLLALWILVVAAARGAARALPGDPVETLLAETAVTIPAEELRAELGLDRPFLLALGRDVGQAMRGDFGRSWISRRPVAPELRARWVRTARLAATSFALAIAAALAVTLTEAALGGALGGHRAWNRLSAGGGALASALPAAWTGPILMLALGASWPHWPVTASRGDLRLASLTLALGLVGPWILLIRARVRDSLGRPYVRAAQARGLGRFRLAWKYGLWPSMGALAAFAGSQLGRLLAGSVLIEYLFGWPGLGLWFVEGVQRRDFPVVEACAAAAAATILLGGALGDLLQWASDPRLRQGKRG